jgi:hypothetical protein
LLVNGKIRIWIQKNNNGSASGSWRPKNLQIQNTSLNSKILRAKLKISKHVLRYNSTIPPSVLYEVPRQSLSGKVTSVVIEGYGVYFKRPANFFAVFLL